MKRMTRLLVPLIVLIAAATFWGCGKSTEVRYAEDDGIQKDILDPLSLQQFANPLPRIPIATPDTTTYPGYEYYTVSIEQTSGFDFGLRKKDGSEITNPATGAPIRTTVWGYNTNGVKTGYLGATIVARSTLPGETGKPVKVKYINNLRDSSGNLLKKHLLTVDPTLMGADGPEIRTVTHLHGGHVEPESDGHPEAWITNDPNAQTGLPADPVSGRPARPNGNTVTYTYDNTNNSEQLWYHDHALGITRLNVYAGLAGNYLIRDSAEDSLNLPKGDYEIPLVIQDRTFNKDGSLHYDASPLVNEDGSQVYDAKGNPVYSSNPEYFGNVITVNGKAWPYLNVEKRKYRFRVLNGSDSRFYNMWLERSDGGTIPAGAIRQIGNDGGLLPAAVTVANDRDNALVLALAERADLVIDFSQFPAGTTLTVRNDAPTPFPGGDAVSPATTGKIMQFRVGGVPASPDTSSMPTTPRVFTPFGDPAVVRYVDLQEHMDDVYLYDENSGTMLQRLRLLLNDLPFDAPATETPHLNTVEDWIIINNTVDMHPMHVHLVDFEVIEKGSIAPGAYTPAHDGELPKVAEGGLIPNFEPDGRPAEGNSPYRLQPNEMGQKDTVRVPPGDEGAGTQGYVRIRAKFDRLGTYMWHCHILAHEDHDMMRPFRVIP